MQLANADATSRLPLLDTPTQPPVPGELFLLVNKLEDAPITATQIATWTRQDPLLSTVTQYIQHGWPGRADIDEIKPYWSHCLELTVHQGCIIWHQRVVVPPPGQECVLGIQWRASRHILAEIPGQEPSLVAMFGQRHWAGGSKLPRMSTGMSISVPSTPTSLVMANPTLDPTSHRFCWPHGRQDVSYHD